MASTDEANGKGIDASVGGLVWVRRRNGSWWPGRVIGHDEVSEGFLVSPRAGTPVKLLGREDASVDWYNLEKSKRVKAFRCGEYDDCIEKAKASAANSGKKAVKYARREDAILHALEIESARLGKDHPDYFCRRENSGGEHGTSSRESPTVSVFGKENGDMTDETSELEDDSDSTPELSRSNISFEEPNHASAAKVQSAQVRRRRTPNDSEDDGTEGVKRMRGLEDLGMCVGSKRKTHPGCVVELLQLESNSLCDSNAGNCTSNGGSLSSLKRKRSQVGNFQDLIKRKNRHLSLTKVLESTAVVSVPVVCDEVPSSNGSPFEGLSDSKVSTIDSNESRKSSSMVINNNNNSESNGVSSDNAASLNGFELCGGAAHTDNKIKDVEISSTEGLVENDSSDRLFDVPFVGEDKPSADFSPIYVSCSSKMPEVANGSKCNQANQIDVLKSKEHNESDPTVPAAVHAGAIGQRIEEGTSKWPLKGKRNSRQTNKNRTRYSPEYVGVDEVGNTYLSGLKQLNLVSADKADCSDVSGPVATYSNSFQGSITQRLLPHRRSRYTVHSKHQMTDFAVRKFSSDFVLYDVKLGVKASYRPQHVPLVSLMSKLNGKAIVGHPVTIETLNTSHCKRVIMEAAEMSYTVARTWETGRGPKKHMKRRSGFSASKSARLRKCRILAKKIRKLSSFTGQKLDEDVKNPVLEKQKGPVITCIPLKLVFSRINEALNSSARTTYRSST